MNQPQHSIVSYASNFEDVVLYRALQHVKNGCYVDVGASGPLNDSNTALFYQKGWRGICLEPISEVNHFWVENRPEDILLNMAAGATQGETTFYVYSNTTQISTCSTETMEHWQRSNHLPDKQIVVPVTTLNQVMEQFLGERVIHLLCIDTEGYEKQVLQGFDLQKYEPWVIVVEATVPGTNTPSYDEWEGAILDAGYNLVYQDGVNRFYLSSKKSELRDFFSRPPNSRDQFITHRHEIAQQKCEHFEKINKLLYKKASFFRKAFLVLLILQLIISAIYFL